MTETRPPYRPRARNKYGAHPTGGHASRREHLRAQRLHIWQRAGKISDLREQVRFELIPAQYGEAGLNLWGKPTRPLLERACYYIADFVYTDNATGQTVVEDTKGVRTRDYVIKRKLMLYIHGIQIREI